MVIGLLVDGWADSSPVGVLLGVAVGVVVGCLGFVVRVRRALR
jgi:F0F1-type ATP synthase assembly protein I